jgi:hypothetical protein
MSGRLAKLHLPPETIVPIESYFRGSVYFPVVLARAGPFAILSGRPLTHAFCSLHESSGKPGKFLAKHP